MKKNITKAPLFFLLFFILSITSCTYNSEEDLYPLPVDGCPTENISYNNDILPILETNCFVCHEAKSPSSGIILEGHSNLLIKVNNGSLIGTIQHDEGWSQMPQSAPKLSDCQIEKINAWVDQGALNN